MQLDIRQFCPKGIYDVVFIQPVDTESDDTLKHLVETAREYEDISSMTFITYGESVDLVSNYTKETFPPSLEDIPATVCGKAASIMATGDKLHPSLQAQLVKLKLIQVMHRQYLKELDKVNRRKALEDELNSLTKEMRKGKKDRSDQSTKSLASIKTKEKESKTRPDEKNVYTTIPENEIIFDDDIFNHVWYYVIQGTIDPDTIVYLTRQYHVTVRAVLRFGMGTIEPSGDYYKAYWDKIFSLFFLQLRDESLEDTILMKHSTTEVDGKAILEEVLYVLKKISDLKLNHLNYIRHIKLDRQNHKYAALPMHCFERYNNIMKRIPFELASEPVVLGCMLDELVYQFENNLLEHNSTEDLLKPHIDIEITCTNPCDTREVLNSQPAVPTIEMPKQLFTPFYTYEGDIVDIIFKTYKKRGSVVVQILDSILKKIEPIRLVTDYKNNFSYVPHKHDVDPTSKCSPKNSEQLIHFMYLLLFSLFEYDPTVPEFEDTELTECIQLLSQRAFWLKNQVKIIDDTDGGAPPTCEVNFFDPIPMEFIWRERLPSSCLMKAVYDAMNEFKYMEKTFCEETDTLLVRFTDHLDNFGINVKVYQVHVRIPVCLRDFCRYITRDESKWLEKNKPPRYVRPAEEQEICQGKKAIIKKDIFKEYRYLLDTNVQLEDDPEEIKAEKKQSVTFQETLEDLVAYPTNRDIIKECSKADPQFLAYPIGTEFFRCRGNRTTFASHDGLKLVVDNVSIKLEDHKCTAVLSYRNNSLVLHSNSVFTDEDNFSFHWLLDDGTIIMFALNPPKPKRKLVVSESTQVSMPAGHSDNTKEVTEEGKGSVRNSVASEKRESVEISEQRASTKSGSLNVKQIPNILSVDKDWFTKMTNVEDGVSLQTTEPENVVLELQTALESGREVYKVNNKLNYLKRRCSKTEIPVTTLLNRILHKRIKRIYGNEMFVRKFDYPETEGKNEGVRSKVDFRITLPNGLYITCYPSQLKKNLCEVKQEYLEKGVDQSGIMDEEFRIFTREGFVLIKRTDGSIAILKSNGDTVKYEKPDSQNEDVIKSNLRRCHCKTINDYRKKLGRIMKGQNQGDYYLSRRAHMRSKKGYVISDDVANMLKNSEIPYLKSSSIKFSGKYTCLQKNKITEKQLYYTTQQQDFFAEEIFFERTDGFQGMFDKTGKLQVKYADKTKITSSVFESKELYDGYVYVSLCFEFEHPHYATVVYNENDNLEVRLNNDVVLSKHTTDNIYLFIGEDVTTVVNHENVKVNKRCPKCSADCTAHFNIAPFFAKQTNSSDEFLRIEDSYNKRFYTNFAGISKRNADFIDGPLNYKQCNHYAQNVYQKMFVINRNYMGDYLWTENMVQQKDQACRSSRVTDLLDVTYDRDRMTKYENEHDNTIDRRFLNSKLLDENFCLTKDKEQEGKAERSVCHTSVTILRQVLDPVEVENLLNTLLKDSEEFTFDRLKSVAKDALNKVSCGHLKIGN
nr:unnamed protein product [Callosobruchus analis]